MMILTNDEMNLMCIFVTGNRQGLLKALSDMRKELAAAEMELRELTDSAIAKLEAMSDEDYDRVELFADFNEEDADAE